jgi:hypothetical protein
MARKIFGLLLVVGVSLLGLSGQAYAAKDTKAPAVKPAATPAKAPVMPARPNVPPLKSSFGMITGTLLKVDNADPANVKLEVKNDADQTTHVISLTQWTNVTKVTDVSELKVGETVRAMTRKMDDKEVAMGVMFGKIKPLPRPRPVAPQASPVAAAPAKAK